MIKYILTTKKFFEEGMSGRVSHAKGFAQGILENDVKITIISQSGASTYFQESSNLKLINTGSKIYLRTIFEILKSLKTKDIVVIRWRPLLPFITFPFSLLTKKLYYEVNTLTGLDSSSLFIRIIVKLSIYLTVRSSHIIVVSQNSKQKILDIVKKRASIYVMPNGFIKDDLEEFVINYNETVRPKNFVYFGRKAEYYDWQNLYDIFSEEASLNLHIFGFNDVYKSKNITFYGEFNHTELIKKLNGIENPILIIHPDSSDTAKSGSPMKLFEYAYLNIPIVIGDVIRSTAPSSDKFIYYESGNKESLRDSLYSAIDIYHDLIHYPLSVNNRLANDYSWKSLTCNWLRTLEHKTSHNKTVKNSRSQE